MTAWAASASILGTSFQQFFQRQPVKDPLFFLLWVCLAFWAIGLTSGYALARRRRVLVSIVVAGAAIVIIQAYGNYQPRGSWWLAMFVLLAALLASRVHFLDRQTSWARTRVFVGEDSGGNILAGLFATAALAMLAAWWIPALPGSVERAAEDVEPTTSSPFGKGSQTRSRRSAVRMASPVTTSTAACCRWGRTRQQAIRWFCVWRCWSRRE